VWLCNVLGSDQVTSGPRCRGMTGMQKGQNWMIQVTLAVQSLRCVALCASAFPPFLSFAPKYDLRDLWQPTELLLDKAGTTALTCFQARNLSVESFVLMSLSGLDSSAPSFLQAICQPTCDVRIFNSLACNDCDKELVSVQTCIGL
jgi:hypothetical protein